MTVQQILDWMDTVRPSAYTPEQKTAWLSDLEAIIWSQVFLQPMGLWKPYAPETDMQARLLLPEGWRRVYTAYMGAMIDLANGEYTQYENSMSLYDRCISELGAWYAETFRPAQNPAGWADLGVHDRADMAEGLALGTLGAGAALLAVRYAAAEPAAGRFHLRVGEDERPEKVYITKDHGSHVRTLGLCQADGGGENLTLCYEGNEDASGAVSVRVLVQPAAGV